MNFSFGLGMSAQSSLSRMMGFCCFQWWISMPVVGSGSMLMILRLLIQALNGMFFKFSSRRAIRNVELWKHYDAEWKKQDAQHQHEGHPSQPGFLLQDAFGGWLLPNAVPWVLRTIACWALGLRGGRMNLINELGCECMFILLGQFWNPHAPPPPKYYSHSKLPRHVDVALVKRN